MPKATGSYRDVLRVSMPIVVSMTTTVVMTFTDRVFLANYSIDAIAAALPAGIIAYVFLIFLPTRPVTSVSLSPSIPAPVPCSVWAVQCGRQYTSRLFPG